MRFTWSLLLVLLLLPVAGLPAIAEEDPGAPSGDEPAPKPEPKPEPDPAVPVYSIEYLMPGEDDLPDGWKLRDSGAPDGSPTEDQLVAMSEACKCSLNDDNFYVQTSVWKSGSERVGVAMVDVDASVWAFRRKVDEAAAAHGWKVMELGAKGRLLILGPGSKQGEVAAAMKEHVVYRLGRLGLDRLNAGGHTDAGRKAALDYSNAIAALAPDTGMAQAVIGVIHWLKSRPNLKRKKVDQAEADKAMAAWGRAFADGVTYPPKGSVLVFCAGEYGQLLLLKKTDDVLAEATRVLQKAVEHEQDGKSNFRRFGNRYNLACCYARSGKTEKAFDMLEKSLETGKSMRPEQFRPQYKNIAEKDPDMNSLRSDPRFRELMEKYKPEPPKRRTPPKKKEEEPKKDGEGDKKDGEGDKKDG